MTRTYTLRAYAVHHRSDARRRLIIRAATSASAMRAAAAHWGLRSQIGLSLTPARIHRPRNHRGDDAGAANYQRSNMTKTLTCSTIDLVHLPAGFGCEEFWMSTTPVTEQQWADVMTSSTSSTSSKRPKTGVTLQEATEFCKRLGPDFHLPTEMEWCRAAGVEPERDKLDQYAVFNASFCPEVGTKLPNEYGLFDMRGLCWEMALISLDAYNICGGGWHLNGNYARSANRYEDAPGHINDLVGFRVITRKPIIKGG